MSSSLEVNVELLEDEDDDDDGDKDEVIGTTLGEENCPCRRCSF